MNIDAEKIIGFIIAMLSTFIGMITYVKKLLEKEIENRDLRIDKEVADRKDLEKKVEALNEKVLIISEKSLATNIKNVEVLENLENVMQKCNK